MVGEHDALGGRTLFLAQPIKADQPCLQCHDTASTAPAALVRRYGPDNGFGWKSGEVVGAQILLVPMAYPQQLARNAFASLLVYLCGSFLLSLVLLDVLLYFTIVRPASKMSRIAEEISKGNLDEAGLVVRGNDEISILARSFNRMQISLTHAMRMLEDHQQQDSVHPS
jgi:protein-histidine pros-kinase